MANTKISGPTPQAATGTDVLPIYGGTPDEAPKTVTAQSIADLASGGGLPGASILTDAYYLPYGMKANGEDSNTNTQILLTPFFFPKVDTFNSLVVNVQTGNAGGLLRAGMYASNSNGMPTGTALVDVEIDAATSGEKSATISWLPTANMLYWSANIVNQSSSIGFITADIAGDGVLLFNLLGAPGLSGAPYQNLSVSGQTYGALPDLTSATFDRAQSLTPLIALRKV